MLACIIRPMVMTTSTVFDEEMKNASAAEVSAAQENIVSSIV